METSWMSQGMEENQFMKQYLMVNSNLINLQCCHHISMAACLWTQVTFKEIIFL